MSYHPDDLFYEPGGTSSCTLPNVNNRSRIGGRMSDMAEKTMGDYTIRGMLMATVYVCAFLLVLVVAVLAGASWHAAQEAADNTNSIIMLFNSPFDTSNYVKRALMDVFFEDTKRGKDDKSAGGIFNFITWLNQQNLEQTDILSQKMSVIQDKTNEVDTFLEEKLTYSRGSVLSSCDYYVGLTNLTFPSMTNLPADLKMVLAFDIDTKKNLSLYPGVTGVYPDAVTGIGAPYFMGNTLNPNVWGKQRSVAHILGYLAGTSIFTTGPSDERLTIILKNLEDRGFDDSPVVKDNLEKRRMMTAFNMDIILSSYDDDLLRFANKLYHSITVNQKPVISSTDEHLMDLMINIQLGRRDHPRFVHEWFYNFSYVVASINPSANYAPTAEEMQKYVTTAWYTHKNSECVRAYIKESIMKIQEERNTCTFTWYWLQSGMSTETIMTEILHNIVAFRQFINSVQLLVEQSINPGPGTGGLSYLKLFSLASTETAKINVIREFLRLELPNGGSFSRKKDAPGYTQAFHSHKLIEIQAEGSPVAWATYNPGRYADFDVNFTSHMNPTTQSTGSKCPFDHSTSVAGVRKSVKNFVYSSADGSTALPVGFEKWFTVFPTPKFAANGFGYRSCAGVQVTMRILFHVFDALKCLVFYKDIAGGPYPNVPLAPYKSSPDYYFAKKSVSNCGPTSTSQ